MEEIRWTIHKVASLRALAAAEVGRRQLYGPIAAFAVDFDVVYDFVHFGEGQTKFIPGYSAISALNNSPSSTFTLPPGTVHEFIRFCARQVSRLPPVSTRDEMISFLEYQIKSEPVHQLDLSKEVKRRLRDYWNNTQDALRLTRRLTLFLDSPNLRSLVEMGVDLQALPLNPQLIDRLRRTLQYIRPDVSLSNEEDSANLATVEAISQIFPMPLVTRTGAVREASRIFNKDWTQSLDQLVLTPEDAIWTVALKEADMEDLDQLRHVLWHVENKAYQLLNLDDWRVDAQIPEELLSVLRMSMFGSIEEFVLAAEELNTEVNELWHLPVSYSMGDADPRAVASELIGQTMVIKEELAHLIGKLDDQHQDLIKSQSQQIEEWKPLLDALGLLGKSQASAGPVIGQLTIMASGAQFNDYRIALQSQNVLALVDSFTEVAEQHRRIFGRNAKREIEQFVQAVSSSHSDPQEQMRILSGALTTAKQTAKLLRLTPGLRQLSYGVRESIRFVPEALKAWEALEKIWTKLSV